MRTQNKGVAGYFSFVLHAHLPYVLHHGTWPHGLEWLLEAAAETYLPLLRTLRTLHGEGIHLGINISFSPILLEQLADPAFKAELPRYIQRKITAAQEDAAFFEQAGEHHLVSLAQHWENVFVEALNDLQAIDGDLIAALRQAETNGSVRLLTSAATHGYAPLIGTDNSLKAQFTLASAVHQRHLGRAPEGVWLPECGYRPAGPWKFPVAPDVEGPNSPVERAGTEAILEEAGLRYTFVDTHLVEDAERLTGGHNVPVPVATSQSDKTKSIYRPYRVGSSQVAVFARDPRSAFQVWSGQYGYPGDFEYLDFHKKRWPGGHRYWRVTGAGLGMEAKQTYFPEAAQERSRAHAEHFVGMVAEALNNQPKVDGAPQLLCAPFDLELFGHWWHEGLLFLENVARVLASGDHDVAPITCSEYLDQYGVAGRIHMHEGSWGANGDNSVWLNSETSSLLSRMYAAELAVRDAARQPAWTDGATGERVARQVCRELLLMESSDWPTLITTGAARDYAERRFREHDEAFHALLDIWKRTAGGEALTEGDKRSLAEAEASDGIFPELNPANWR